MHLRILVVLVLVFAAPLAAQERPFVFSIATATDGTPAIRFDYDVGVGERAFQSDTSNQPEQRVGIHASRGRFTLLARVGISEAGSSDQSSQAGEVLYSFLRTASGIALAGGGGAPESSDPMERAAPNGAQASAVAS